MVRSTILCGYILVMLAGLSGWALAMTPPAPFSVAALLVVLIGSSGYLLCCHTIEELQTVRQSHEVADPVAVRRRLIHLAGIARLEGGRGLERALGDLAGHPLGAAGLRLIADGSGPLETDQALGELARRLDAAARVPAEVWSSVARGAVHAGALLSLVQLSWALMVLPPELAYHAVAASLSGTLWGLLIAWLIAQPRIVRAKRVARAAAEVHALWVAGWSAIAEGVHPLRLEDRLTAVRAA